MSGLLLLALLAFDSPPAETEQPTASVNGSPAFTQDRQFTNARLWLLDPGNYTVEQSWSGEWGVPRALAGSSFQDDQLLQTELAVGFMPHLELDIYANFDLAQDGSGNYQLSPTGRTGVEVETRIAIGHRWGQYWGNPVVDLALWGQIYESTRLEARLLLGGEVLVPKLLGALNLMFARNSFHDDAIGVDYEIKAYLGLTYELVPDVLRVGAEATLGWDSHDSVDANDDTLVHPSTQAGPVILLTEPHKRLKLLFALLFGVADWDPPWETQLIVATAF